MNKYTTDELRKRADAAASKSVLYFIVAGVLLVLAILSKTWLFRIVWFLIAGGSVGFAFLIKKAGDDCLRELNKRREIEKEEAEKAAAIKAAAEERQKTIEAQRAAEAARWSRFYTGKLEIIDRGQEILARIYKDLPPYEDGADFDLNVSEDEIVVSVLGERIALITGEDAEKVHAVRSPRIDGYTVDGEIDAFGKASYFLSVNIKYLNE